jgi:VCBS repeat protein
MRLLRPCAAFVLAWGAAGCGEPAAPGLTPEQAMKVVALENRGIGALERYDYGDALAPLREASQMHPKWIAGRFNLALALIHADRDDPTQAAAILDGILKDEPDQPHANFMAAWIAERSGPEGQERALALYKKAYAATGKDPFVGSKYGAMLGRTDGREKDAVAVLEECHAKRPTLVTPVYQLMLLWRQLGDEAKGEKYRDLFEALNAPVRPDIDRSMTGTKVQDAYGNMGPYSMAIRDFGLPEIVPAAKSGDVTAGRPEDLCAWKTGALPKYASFLGCAVLDFDRDGDLDLFVCGGEGPCGLLRNDGGKFTDVAAEAGAALKGVYGVAAAEFDVLEGQPPATSQPGRRAKVDLVLVRETGLTFLRDDGGRFTDATKESGLDADPGDARALLAFDADQDGDVDLFVCGGPGQPNRLWANSGAAKFTEVAKTAGVEGDFRTYGPAAMIDFDDDGDLDLLVARPEAPPAVFANDRGLEFHAVPAPESLGPAPYGLCAWGDRVVLQGDAGATLVRASAGLIDGRAVAGAPGGPAVSCDPRGLGVRDLVFADGTYLAASRAHGMSPFDPPKHLFDSAPGTNVVAFDTDGDGVEEIVLVRPDAAPQAVRLACAPRGNSVVCEFEGVISNSVQAGWSNLEGRGALVEVKAGVNLARFRIGNPSGYGCAAPAWIAAGVGDAKEADFLRMLWPDGVQQAVLAVPSGQANVIVEEQRRPDSCPLLFSWDGTKFAYVTDFLGVGGIGFLVAPGVYGAPDPTESVKVDASLVAPTRSGMLAFKAVEAMEEACYVDAADLQVIDHPAGVTVYPDERFAGEPPFPEGDVVAYRREILPVSAKDGAGADVTDRVLAADRRWPDSFRLHPRLTGATSEQTLELDFGDRLADVKRGDPLVLCANGWIEYGYTRTTVAAAGEGFSFLPPTLETWSAKDAAWKPLVANLGYPAGFPRVMTYDVTGLVSRDTPRLRIRTTFEIYWDKVWLSPRCDAAKETRVTTLAPAAASLRWVGYPRVTKPDGCDPPVYDYGTLEPSMPWKAMEGDFTRYGDVLPLVTKADDMYVVYGKGEEIEFLFDPSKLPPLPAGWRRSYVVRFDGWCKGQEMYTAFGSTVEPLPFHGMSNYPYRADERYPDDEAHRRYRAEWNTRRVRAPAH